MEAEHLPQRTRSPSCHCVPCPSQRQSQAGQDAWAGNGWTMVNGHSLRESSSRASLLGAPPAGQQKDVCVCPRVAFTGTSFPERSTVCEALTLQGRGERGLCLTPGRKGSRRRMHAARCGIQEG